MNDARGTDCARPHTATLTIPPCLDDLAVVVALLDFFRSRQTTQTRLALLLVLSIFFKIVLNLHSVALSI
jgi:hypothetical protein